MTLAAGRRAALELVARLAVAILCAGIAATATAQPTTGEKKLQAHPGYVDFGTDAAFDDDALKLKISVTDAMLRLVAAAARETEPELASMIEKLVAIEVRVFDVDGVRSKAVAKTIHDTATRLRAQSWAPAIDVRLEDSQGFLYFRFRDDRERPVGVAGMFLEPGGEAVFINIVGEIDPALVGRLAARFNLDLLGQALPPASDD